MEEFFDNIIHTYSQEEAINDGILVKIGEIAGRLIVFTSNLWASGDYDEQINRIELTKRGLMLLQKPDPEDTDYMRLRVIEKGRIWVIANAEGITFMRPEDY